MGELGSYDAAVAVWSCDFAPDDSDLSALSFSCRSVDKCYTLSEIESVIFESAICRGIPRVCLYCSISAVLFLLLLSCVVELKIGFLTVHHSSCRHLRSSGEMCWGLCFACLFGTKGACP